MKKSSLLIAVCLTLFFLLPIVPLYSAKPNQADYVPVTESSHQSSLNMHPENTSPLYVYGGYGYFGWKMISTSDYLSIFTGQESPGLGYSHDATPYVVKRYGVKSNILIFSLGLDYLSDTLSLPSEYNNRDDLEEKEDKRAQQLKLLSGLRLGNYMLHANVIYREFSSTITSKGLRHFLGNTLPLPYYPKSGGIIYLDEGETTSWYTRYTQYEGKLEIMHGWGSMDFGLKVIQFEAPSEIQFTTIVPVHATGQALMYTENTMYTLFFGIKSLTRLAGDFYLGTYTPIDLGFSGYRAKSQYFEAGSLSPLAFTSFSTSSVGTFLAPVSAVSCEGGGGA